MRKEKSKVTRIDIGFLHASPLTLGASKVPATAEPPIDFVSEAQKIKTALKESKQQFQFKSMVATRKNFTDMISREPNVLHISCHGLKRKGTSKDDQEELNHLLFETEKGLGDLVN